MPTASRSCSPEASNTASSAQPSWCLRVARAWNHKSSAGRTSILMVVGLACGAADAADKTQVDQATKQVDPGAKFSGAHIKEFFNKTFGS
jgi:hypothetical protein